MESTTGEQYIDECSNNTSMMSTKSNSNTLSYSGASDYQLFYLNVLKPFSRAFPMSILQEVNYFYALLKKYNQNKQNVEISNKQRPFIKSITEIILNIIDSCDYKECLLYSKIFKDLQ